MKIEIMMNNRVKSLAEPFLLPGISGYLLLGITSKMVELSHILVDGPISLSYIAKLFLLSFHHLIQNVVPSEGITKLLPSHYVTIRLHCNIVLPPLKSSTFQKVCREYAHLSLFTHFKMVKHKNKLHILSP